MAYGSPWSSRGFEPDPRDVVEDAARAAGMSVNQWLNRAADNGSGDDYSSHGSRHNRQSHRQFDRRNIRPDSRYSEDRVARIVDDAMETMQHSVRSNEERTAFAIEALGRQINGGSLPGPGRSGLANGAHDEGNQVQSLIAELQRALGANGSREPNNSHTHHGSEHESGLQNPNLVRQLEGRIANMVQTLEAKSQPSASRGNGRDLRHLKDYNYTQDGKIGKSIEEMHAALRGLERRKPQDEVLQALRALDKKVGGLERMPAQNEVPIADLLEEMTALRRSVATQQPAVDFSSVERQIAQVAERVDALSNTVSSGSVPAENLLQPMEKIQQELSRLRDRPQAGARQFESLFEEIAALRNSMQSKHALPGQSFSSLEKQIASMGDRLDAISDKLTAPRFNGPRDLRAPKPVDNGLRELAALEELKLLITESQTSAQQASANQNSANDRHVLDALQMLERKVDAIERGPSDLAARLDRIQSSMTDKPSGPLPANIEILLRNLATRLETVQAVPSDDAAFARLQEDIQHLSRKLESTPAAMQVPAIADMSGLERSMSDHFRQMDAWKADLGLVTEQAVSRAASKAAADAISQTSGQIRGTASLAENEQVQRTLTDIHVSQQDAERRTNQTLEAVHDTLRSVVNRLVEMESDAAKRAVAPVAAQAAPQPLSLNTNAPAMFAPPSQRQQGTQRQETAQRQETVQRQETPQVPFKQNEYASGIEDYAPSPLMPLPLEPIAALHPPPLFQSTPVQTNSGMPSGAPTASEGAYAGTVAAMRAQRLGAPAPTVVEAPANKSAIAAAFSAARDAVSSIKLGKGSTKQDSSRLTPELTPSKSHAAPEQIEAHSVASAPLDLPLEPGSGRPAPGARSTAQDIGVSDPKADFLAAARRAAQAAADQSAEVLSQGSTHALTKGKAALKGAQALNGVAVEKVGLKKKHAILLGLAALIVAVGASVQFMGVGLKKPASTVETPDRVSTLSVPPKTVQQVAPSQQIALSQQAQLAPPRQILPSAAVEALPPSIRPNTAAKLDPLAITPKIDERISAAPTRAAQPTVAFQPADPATVGSLGTEANRSIASTITAPALPAKPAASVSNDPLFKFEGVRDADRLKEAARNGDPSAFIELGNRFSEGRGAPRDPKAAALWFERASDFGSAPAQYRLGALYREGRGVERNPKIALKYFSVAAEAGNARAMHNTAVLLAEGVNGTPDYAGAADWFKKSAEFGIKDSQFNLAILYARGLGTTQDLMASYAWFAAAAGHGDDDATKKRDEVASRLSPERLQQAKLAAEAWKPKTPDPSSNEVTMPTGGWDNQVKAPSPAAKAKQSRL